MKPCLAFTRIIGIILKLPLLHLNVTTDIDSYINFDNVALVHIKRTYKHNILISRNQKNGMTQSIQTKKGGNTVKKFKHTLRCTYIYIF